MGLLSKLSGKVKSAASSAKKVAVKAKDAYSAYKAIPRDVASLGVKAGSALIRGDTEKLSSIGRGDGLNTSQNVAAGAVKGAGETVLNLGRLGDKGLAAITKPLRVKSVSQTPQMQAGLDSVAKELKPVGTAQTVGYGAEKVAELLGPGMKLGKVGTGAGLKSVGAVQKVVAKVPVIGKTLAKKSPKIVQAAIQAGADGIVGAGQSVITDLAKGEKDWNKIKKNAKTSAAISAVAPLAIGGAGGLLKGLSHQVGQKEGLVKGILNVGEETLAGAGLKEMPKRALDRTGNIGYQLSKKFSKLEDSDNDAVSAIATKARDFTKNYLDDRAPILRDFSGKLRDAGATSDDIAAAANAQARGRTVDPRTMSKAYDQRAHFQRIAAGDDVGRLADDTDTYADMLTKLETTRTGTEGAESLANVQSKLDDFLATKSPEQLEKIKQAHESTVRAFNQSELAEDVAAGLISKEAADEAMIKYPNYSKQYIMEYFDDAQKSSPSKKQLSRTLSDIGWKSRLEKARGDLEALPATQANILSSMVREKKRALNSEVLTMVNLDKKNAAGVFEFIGTNPDEVDNLSEAVPVFNNGVKEFYKVKDRAVLDYFKGVEKSDDNQLTSMLKFAADWTRKTATQYNPVFAFKNAMIDYQTAQSNLPAGMALTFDDWAKGFGSADELVSGVKKGKTISKESKELLDLGIPLTSFGRNLSKVDSEDLTKIIKGSKASLNPIKQIMSGVERSEFATRYAVVKAAKRAGITDPNELRELARNATIDFSVSGQNIREFNKVIPFLNARVQGLRNTMKAIAKDPAGFTRKQQMLSIYPQMMVDQWNKQFDMSRIPEHERDNNLIFVIRETKDPETGKSDLVRFSIPRADGQKVFPMMMQALQDDTKTTPEKAMTMLKSLAEFTPVDQVPKLGGAFMNTIDGLNTNKDWRGYDIVPASQLNAPNRAQKSASTSPTIVKATDALAKLTGQTEFKDGAIDLSPKKTEFIIKTLGGGVTTKALQGIDAAAGLMTNGKPPGASDFGIDAIMSKIPGPGEILKSGQLSVDPEMAKQQADIEQADKLRKFNVKEEADRAIDLIMKAPVEERAAVIDQLQKEGTLTKDVQDKIKDTIKEKKYVGGINPAAPNLVKSKQIVNYIDAAKTPEQKKKRIDEVQEANLLSDNVKDYMIAQKFVDQVEEAKTPEEKKKIIDKFAPSLSESVKNAVVDIKKSGPYFAP